MVEVTKNGKKVLEHPTCGGIMTDKQQKIKDDGNYVYEFYNHNSKQAGEYKSQYPGFLQDTTHPNKEICVPCCFTKWDTPLQKNRRKQCMEKDETNAPEDTKRIDYIMGPEKYPLDNGRWGYPQFNVQAFFQEVSADCQISKTNTNIKDNKVCLLRHGIEISNNQSFIACIANIRYYGEQKKSVPTISEMKDIIINAIDLDKYMTYQNGNNYTNFIDKSTIDDIDISTYKNTKIYKKIYKHDKKNQELKIYLKQLISSYENFINYLKDDTEMIDYTYLWDIICEPNPKLFTSGINMVILDIINNDITNDIQFICPTNHYSRENYKPNRNTAFIIKYNNYYEPLYTMELGKKMHIEKVFKETNPDLPENIKNLFKNIISPLFKNACKPLPSMPNKYNQEHQFKHPILLSLLMEIIDQLNNYKIEKQILNYDGKVVGLMVKQDNISVYIPCYPSSLMEERSYTFMNDPSLYTDYETTTDFLISLYEDSKKQIPCKPHFKVVEDKHIVGVITETNQFIQLSEPFPNGKANDDIPILRDNNYIYNSNKNPMKSINLATLNNTKYDTKRVEYIKKLTLETNFYNAFRNTIRILLNNNKHLKLREHIESIINHPMMLYHTKMKKIKSELRGLVENSITFSEKYDIDLINDVFTCLTYSSNKCTEKSPVCSLRDNKCHLVIPKNNLLNEKINNETMYFGKMSDELIRYTRIKSFIFQPQQYLSFDKLNYDLKSDEIIIIQSLLTKEYFEGLNAKDYNKYITYNTYDNTDPLITQTYENDINIYPKTNNENKPIKQKQTILLR